MTGFVQPQWSGFAPPAERNPAAGASDGQPSGIEVERSRLGRPDPASPPASAEKPKITPAPVTSASPLPFKA